MSHSGRNPELEAQLAHQMKELFGEYPDGRLNKDDEGATPIAISHQNGRVVMQFARNLNWVGFTADQAIDIAQSLIDHARSCGSSKPLTLKVGS